MAKKSDNLLWRPNLEGSGEITRYKLGFIFRDKRSYSIVVGQIKKKLPTKTLKDAKLLIDVYSAGVYKNSAKRK